MTLNKIFEENKEIPYVASMPWGQKKYKRVIGLKQIAKTIWCGTITRGQKVTGRWVWNMYRFEKPSVHLFGCQSQRQAEEIHETSSLRENQRIGSCRNQETGGGKQC